MSASDTEIAGPESGRTRTSAAFNSASMSVVEGGGPYGVVAEPPSVNYYDKHAGAGAVML